MKTITVLREVKHLLSEPEHWIQYRSHEGDAYCLTGAIDEATCGWGQIYDDVCIELRNALPSIEGRNGLITWNDAEGRTHAEVIDLIDRTIAREAGK